MQNQEPLIGPRHNTCHNSICYCRKAESSQHFVQPTSIDGDEDLEIAEGSPVLSESNLKLRLTNMVSVIQYETDVDNHNMKLKESLASMYSKRVMPINLTVMDEF